ERGEKRPHRFAQRPGRIVTTATIVLTHTHRAIASQAPRSQAPLRRLRMKALRCGNPSRRG
ncbi:MAG: hypothetical protein WEB58_12470, partial [Planctomycetaceae bacterium]